MVLKNLKNIYIHMNYRDFYKTNKDPWKEFYHLVPKGISIEKFCKGAEKELKEHPQLGKAGAARVAAQHLKNNPTEYDDLQEKELLKGINLENGCCEDGLPKREDGALNIEHDGRPIKLAKIVQVGSIGGKIANGELSGYTKVGTTGEPRVEEKDKGGLYVQQDGDKEPITAGGKGVESNLASKTVGGEIVPGEGQEQGGPNTKGNISCTPKINDEEDDGTISLTLQEAKSKLRNIVKEILKEITFNKESGKWERLDEGHKPNCQCGFCRNKGSFGKKKEKKDVDENVNMKMGASYKISPNPTLQTPGTQDLPRIQAYEPEITEMYDDEEEYKIQERYTKLATAKRNLYESELEELKDLRMKLENITLHKKSGISKLSETVNMKMGPSYKADVQTYRCSDCDQARTVQYEPEISENHEETDMSNPEESQEVKIGQQIKQLADKLIAIHQPEKEIKEGLPPGFEPNEKHGHITKKLKKQYGKDDPRTYATAWSIYNKMKENAEEQEEAGLNVEAGGAAVQHSSARTVPDGNLPQLPKNRHRGDIDENEMLKGACKCGMRGKCSVCKKREKKKSDSLKKKQ